MATMAAKKADALRRALAAYAKCNSPDCIGDYDAEPDYSKTCEPGDHWQDVLSPLPAPFVEYEYRGTAGEAYLYEDGSVLHLGRDAFLYPQVIRRGDEVAAVKTMLREDGLIRGEWEDVAPPSGAAACLEREYAVNGEALFGRIIYWLSGAGAPMGYEARIRDGFGERMVGYAPTLRQAQRLIGGRMAERGANVAAQ